MAGTAQVFIDSTSAYPELTMKLAIHDRQVPLYLRGWVS
jgi:hypothetical protein